MPLRAEHGWNGNQAQLAAALGSNGSRSSACRSSHRGSREEPQGASAIQDRRVWPDFFASPRSFDGKVGRLLSLDEMTVPERAAREKLLQELAQLRSEALDARSVPWPRKTAPGPLQEIAESLSAGPCRD